MVVVAGEGEGRSAPAACRTQWADSGSFIRPGKRHWPEWCIRYRRQRAIIALGDGGESFAETNLTRVFSAEDRADC